MWLSCSGSLIPAGAATILQEGEILFFIESPGPIPSDIQVWTSFWMGDREVVIVSAAPAREEAISGLGERYGRIETPGSGQKLFIVSSRRGIDSSLLDRCSTVLLCDARVALIMADQGSADFLIGEGMEIRAIRPTVRFKGVTPPLSPRQTSAAQDPIIQQIIDLVNQSGVYNWIGNLSGENSVTIGGLPYTILTRHSRMTASIEKATQYSYEYFQGQGLNVTYQDFAGSGYTCRNVVAVQTGAVNSGNIYIVCAHVDDTINGVLYPTIAPGADDNASGSTAVLIAASILSRYAFENTIRYVLFTGEEQGLEGSYAYVQQCAAAGDNILGALNFDMISYDADLDGRAEIYCGTRPESGALGDLLLNTINTYSLALSPVKFTSGSSGWSDHSSFWDAGYPAILGIEDNGSDFNPDYHSLNDKRVHCNLPYATNYVKAAVGTMARLAVPIPSITPMPTTTPEPTPGPTPPPSLVFEAKPESLTPGERFTLGLTVQGNILRPFDFYIAADTPYGVYTVSLNGSHTHGVTPLYRGTPALQGPKSATIYNNVTLPALRSGTYTFYSAAVDAGKVPPVSSLSELTTSTPYVIAFGRAPIILH
ncbi:MAG: M28 family peptidase [Candidatus Aureabacteria bacterium]|nr:M28 family peptidase [Candidatus Auribacterota bacterium]